MSTPTRSAPGAAIPLAATPSSADQERPIDRLIGIMRRLRDPERGCPWDVKQSFGSIAPYTIEEAYEVADAIAREDMGDLKDELGDLLLQVIFHAQIADEKEIFGFDDVAASICDKLVRRHPHVFGDADRTDDAAVKRAWEDIKASERAAKAERRVAAGLPPEPQSALDDVPVALPALTRAEKLQKRAARVGFDWPDSPAGTATLKAKIAEEIDELTVELAVDDGSPPSEEAVMEFGDLLFALVNFGRRYGIDPETALSRANTKFAKRFRKMEESAGQKEKSLSEMNLETLEELWLVAKRGD